MTARGIVPVSWLGVPPSYKLIKVDDNVKKLINFKNYDYICCVFRPVNGCSTSGLQDLCSTWKKKAKNPCFCYFLHFLNIFWQKMKEKVVLASKKWFWPANGMRSTHSVDEVHNIHCFCEIRHIVVVVIMNDQHAIIHIPLVNWNFKGILFWLRIKFLTENPHLSKGKGKFLVSNMCPMQLFLTQDHTYRLFALNLMPVARACRMASL